MRFAILSAGEGSRLAAEGLSIPKPLVPIHGVPMIERLAGVFMECGAERIAVIVNGENPQTVSLLENLKERMPIDLVVKRTPSPMHSLLELAPYLEADRFCATTVDTVFSHESLRLMIESWSRCDVDGMMGVTRFIDDEKPLYVDADDEMMISGFHDTQGTCRFVSAGVYALSPRSFGILRECVASGNNRMRYFQRQLLVSGLRLKAFDMGQVVDVDHVSDIAKAEQIAVRQ